MNSRDSLTLISMPLRRAALILAVICASSGTGAVAFAHDPIDRLKKGDFEGVLDDSLRTGWVMAGLSAAGAAALAAWLRKRLRQPIKPPKHWPKDLKGPTSFCELGKAFQGEDAFPKNGSDIEKASYVFERMRLAAHVYKMRASAGGRDSKVVGVLTRSDTQGQAAGAIIGVIGGAYGGAAVGAKLGAKLFGTAGGTVGGPLGAAAGILLGAGLGWLAGERLAKWWDEKSPDQENADGLKSLGLGNCGEWSWGFNSVMDCAGISNRVIFADKDGTPGIQGDFYSNDTAIMVRDIRGKKNLIYDIFRHMHHGQDDGTVHDLTQTSEWKDLPMTETDGADSWLGRLQSTETPKPYVKDHQGNVIFEAGAGYR